MAELIARGPNAEDSWRRLLPAGQTVTLGRLESDSQLAAPWDKGISRRHAHLTWRDGRLSVRRDGAGRNPIFYQGQAVDEFTVALGESFVIGQTTFTLREDESLPTPGATPRGPAALDDLPEPVSELTCSSQELRLFKYIDPDERIEVLAALPEVIRLSPSDAELEGRVLAVLLRGIPRAEAAAVVRLTSAAGAAPEVEVSAALSRDPRQPPLKPSRQLIATAIGQRRQSVLYRWDSRESRPDFTPTVNAAFDWAICAPLPDDPKPGWGLYVAGRSSEVPALGIGNAPRDHLKGDLKFAELVADIFGSLRQVLDLQRRHAQLASILSPTVLAAIAGRDVEEVLRPRQTEVTVLFCDLRGSCRISEEGQDDLQALWERVSEALGIMASRIIEHEGVIGDFQGDAAMGFWGWPLDCPEQVQHAARAALAIRKRFALAAQRKDHALAGFTCGIGIANGPAIAGKLGAYDQAKVDVFGPVVNLAARLESMTKQLGVPILIDERCAARLAEHEVSTWCRMRRLARVQPAGMRTVLTVSELLPPQTATGDSLREQDRKDYEAAFEAFLARRWDDARQLLRPLRQDGPSKFLRDWMDRNQGTPPGDWDGAIVLSSK
jgi:adenylate cyclase